MKARASAATVGLGVIGVIGWGLLWEIAACRIPDSEYRCQRTDQCVQRGVQGTCELDRFCSFPDEACPSGRRYAEASGSRTGNCVDESRIDLAGEGDAAMDASIDMAVPADLELVVVAGRLGGAGNSDGVGALARFNTPRGLVAPGDGSVYVADSGGLTIRKIEIATGAVTTWAGATQRPGAADGAGAAARFNRPVGITTDGAGNLYVADSLNFTIRKIAIASGVTTTVAGIAGSQGADDGALGVGRLRSPAGLAYGAGALYIADEDASTIRKLDLASGMLTTIAGTANTSGSTDAMGPAARFDRPSGVAFAAGSVFVTDRQNHTVRKIDGAANVTTFAGTAGMPDLTNATGTAARFASPSDVATDGTSLYVADMNNSCIRRIDVATAAVTTFAGVCGTAGSVDGQVAGSLFNLPSGVAANAAGLVYVSDTSNHTVRRIAAGQVTTLGAAPFAGITDGASARFSGPSQVVSDGAGRLYVSDRNNDRIRVVDLSTMTTTTLVTGFDDPRGLAIDNAAGALYVADFGQRAVFRVDIATKMSAVLAGFPGLSGDEDLSGLLARFHSPTGLALGPQGRLYVADAGNTKIRVIDVATGDVSSLTGATGMPATIDGDATTARFEGLLDLTVDSQYLYASQANHVIRRIAFDGTTTTIAGTIGELGSLDGPQATARLWKPTALALDGSGRLFFADTQNHAIRLVTLATGEVSTYAGVMTRGGVRPGPLPAQLNEPVGLALVTGGWVVTSFSENAVLRIQ